MTKTVWMNVCAGCVVLLAAPGSVLAGDDNGSLPGPKYSNLRFNEDFSYLKGAPDSYQGDFFDPIKYIEFGDGWTLSLGGELRYRLEAETNKALGATRISQDTFNTVRLMFHADFKYRDAFRIFVQGVDVFDMNRNRFLPLRGGDENRRDLQQLFFDLRILGEELPLTLRIGRQDLQYGAQRLISPLNWAQTRRRFDAVKLFAKGETWDIDMFYAKPVVIQRDQRDRFNEDYDFYGIYATYKGIPDHGLDIYLLASDKTGFGINPNGKGGDESRFTAGGRFWGKSDGYDYEAEVAGQWGRWASDTIQAWSITLNGGYTWADIECKPRFGLGFDWASGDEDPTDGKVGTFDQLFPLGHSYFGYLDLIGRQNVTAINANLSAWAVPGKVKATMAYHAFWLNDDNDALYNAGGAATRRDPTGDSGHQIGQELDLTVKWKLCPHSALLFGYSHFFNGNFIQDTGISEDADLFYLQYGFKF